MPRSRRLPTEPAAQAVPDTLPPPPARGGSYELQNGEWVCTQQTLPPGQPEQQPACPMPTPVTHED